MQLRLIKEPYLRIREDYPRVKKEQISLKFQLVVNQTLKVAANQRRAID
jgi:hypothetical protein